MKVVGINGSSRKDGNMRNLGENLVWLMKRLL